jgi:hypothetical protein
MMKHVCDTQPVTIQVVNLTFPCSHASIIQKTREMLEKYNEAVDPEQSGDACATGKQTNQRVRMVIVDTVASNPG